VILEVRSDNPSAAMFYEKLGFIKLFEKPLPREEHDLWIFCKKIDKAP
jgi:ribosomal protein S18 acetylase RimI-like enzyme